MASSLLVSRAVLGCGAAAASARLTRTLAFGAHRRWAGTWHASAIPIEFPGGAAQPRVEEAIVNVTFVNHAGERTRLAGLVGESLYQLARRHEYQFMDVGCGGGGSAQDKLHKEGGWYEPKFGEGAQCHYCHVIIPKSHYSALPPKQADEVEQLRTYPFPEDMTDTSRLACQVMLTAEMEGMVVFAPDGPPSIDI